MTQDRRITNKLPGQPLVFTDAALITAGLAHLEAEKAAACLVHAKDNVWVGVGTKGALRGLLSDDTASQSQAVPSELASLPIHTSTDICGIEWMAEEKFVKLSDVQSLFSHSAATGKVPEAVAALQKARADLDTEQARAAGSNKHIEAAHQYQHAIFELVKAALASPAAPLAGKAEPTAKIPQTAQEAIDFLSSHYESMEEAAEPDNVRFQLTAHDLVSAFRWWFDLDTAPLAAVPAEEASEVEYELHQNDELVAGASGKNAYNEIMHYAAQYGQDGPVEVFKVVRTKLTSAEDVAPAEPAPILPVEAKGLAKQFGYPPILPEPAPIPASALTDEDSKAISRAAECVDSYGRDDLAEKLRSLLTRLSTPTAQGTAEPVAELYEILQQVAKELDECSFSQSLVGEDGKQVWRYIGNGQVVADRVRAAVKDYRHIAAQAPAGRDAQPFPLIIDIGYRKTLRRQDRKFGPPSWDLYDEDGKLVRVLNTYEENFVDSALKAMGGKSHAAEQASGGAK